MKYFSYICITMNELDLHGLTHDDAISKTEEFLLMESLKGIGFNCRIITGNSKILQDKIINEIILKHNFKFFIPSWNTGQIIVS